MFCKKCGNELKEEWTVCPCCGTRISITQNNGGSASKNTNEGLLKNLGKAIIEEDELNELRGQKKFVIYLFREHPIRVGICVPLAIFTAYMMCKFLLALFSWTSVSDAIEDVLSYGITLWLCEMGLWLLYGPINYKQVKEEVTNKPQKYGILSKVATLIVIFVLISCVNDTEETPGYAEEGGYGTENIQYINTTVDEIMRYPDSAIGRYVCIRGRAWVILGTIGIWDENTENNIISVNADYEELSEPKPMNGDIIEVYGQVIQDKYTDKPEIAPNFINILEMSK